MGLGLFHPIDLRPASIYEAWNLTGWNSTPSNGSTVTSFTDLMGNQNLSNRYTAGGAFPKFQTAQINSRPVVQFNAGSSPSGLYGTSTSYAGDMTVYLVCNFLDVITAAQSAFNNLGTNPTGFDCQFNTSKVCWHMNTDYISGTGAVAASTNYSISFFYHSNGSSSVVYSNVNNVNKFNTTAAAAMSASTDPVSMGFIRGHSGGSFNYNAADMNIGAVYWFKSYLYNSSNGPTWQSNLMDMYAMNIAGTSP